MENKRTGYGLIILLIGIAIAAIAYLGYLSFEDIHELREFEKEWENDCQVDIQRINDSTYHINLGDGSACFTIEKSNDSLSFNSVNLVTSLIKDDTITVMSSAKSAKWNHVYKIAYHDLFDDTIPDRSKIKFKFN